MKNINITDTILALSSSTGIRYGECETICKAFEKRHGAQMLHLLMGREVTFADTAPDIALQTGLSAEQCAAVLIELQAIVQSQPFIRQ